MPRKPTADAVDAARRKHPLPGDDPGPAVLWRARAERAAAFEQAILAAREAGAVPGAALPALAEERPRTPGTPMRPP